VRPDTPAPDVGPREHRFPRSYALYGALALAAAGICVALVLILSASDSSGAVTSNQNEIKRQLVERLHEHSLQPHEVTCVRSGSKYEGAAVIRCNVNYGDPHIEAICSVLRGNVLLTNHDDAAIPCEHDDAGWRAPVQTF